MEMEAKEELGRKKKQSDPKEKHAAKDKVIKP